MRNIFVGFRAGHMDIRAQSFASQGCHIEGSGSITARALQHRPGVNTFLESSSSLYLQETRQSSAPVPGSLCGDLKVNMVQGSFQATEFRSGVSLRAAEKLQLLAAPVQDSYHKTQVLKKNIVRVKTQSLAGQGLSYRNCGVHGVLRVDTPLLEMSAQGAPPALEIAPRESFCQVLQVLEPCTQEEKYISTQFKPAFKAVLGVGITALSAVLAPPLVGSVIAASGHAFIQNSGLECLADHRHIHFREMLKDAGKSLAVSGASLALGEILPDHRAIHAVKNTALNCAVYQADPLKALAGQGLIQVSGFLAGQIGLEYQSKEINFLEHKLLHGALSLASTLSLQAINSGHLDWSRAFLAAGTTMAAESGAEGLVHLFKDYLPKPEVGEAPDGYLQRCNRELSSFAEKTSGALRVLTAAGLCLAGKDASSIYTCDQMSANALQNNFAFILPALVATLSALEVVEGTYQAVQKVKEGDYLQAAGCLAKTVINALPGVKGLKIAVGAGETAQNLAQGYRAEGLAGAGKVLAKEIAGQKFSKALGRGLGKLAEKAGAKGRAVQKTAFSKKAQSGAPQKNSGPKPQPRAEGPICEAEKQQRLEQYLAENEGQMFVSGLYGSKDLKDAMDVRHERYAPIITKNNSEQKFTAQHHLAPHATNERIIDPEFSREEGFSILIPVFLHNHAVHAANTLKLTNYREALFVSIQSMRNSLNQVKDPVLRQKALLELNAHLLDGIKFYKQNYPQIMEKTLK
ncbi:hypothetical protein P618_200288 [Holospora obtusa F1]|uniref:Uncharacterized protein n=1 Tax=Holospora obtusa F1 TaxID=1399147 RepID=W6TUU6_HOLOB|nr:hypothetical protein [Holospora obtusa]ETZ07527.1 hypothetical protein P618_200288 [Holospora obtusa F1]